MPVLMSFCRPLETCSFWCRLPVPLLNPFSLHDKHLWDSPPQCQHPKAYMSLACIRRFDEEDKTQWQLLSRSPRSTSLSAPRNCARSLFRISLPSCNRCSYPYPSDKSFRLDPCLLWPHAHKVYYRIPDVRLNPLRPQSSPRLFFSATCSSISSESTSFFFDSFSSNTDTFSSSFFTLPSGLLRNASAPFSKNSFCHR